MAQRDNFGHGARFGDGVSRGTDGFDPSHCARCEAMLADALDETLGPADQASFAAHLALCPTCEAMLADAKRGAAWLEMLRDPRPEPSTELFARILAQTSGVPLSGAHTAPIPGFAPAMHPVGYFADAGRWVRRNGGISLGERLRAGLRGAAGAGMLQPRFTMTAAMAFFSIALTINLFGVRLSDVHASNLSPSMLRRGFYRANARVVQYYEGLRVIYELESRVHDLETEPVSGGSPQPPAPATQPASAPEGSQPDKPGAGSSDSRSPGAGNSRRDGLFPAARLVAARPRRPRGIESQLDLLGSQGSTPANASRTSATASRTSATIEASEARASV